jgi:hypothetical protein
MGIDHFRGLIPVMMTKRAPRGRDYPRRLADARQPGRPSRDCPRPTRHGSGSNTESLVRLATRSHARYLVLRCVGSAHFVADHRGPAATAVVRLSFSLSFNIGVSEICYAALASAPNNERISAPREASRNDDHPILFQHRMTPIPAVLRENCCTNPNCVIPEPAPAFCDWSRGGLH